MNPPTSPHYDLCIYHARCPDGAASAWVARRRFSGIELHPAGYGDPAPDVSGRRVLVADFSYPRDVLERMAAQAADLRVLDHHASSAKVLAGLPFCEFDMARSGAGMVWDHLFPGRPRPWIVAYVEDRDLWRHALPNTREIAAYVATLGYDVQAWEDAPPLVELAEAIDETPGVLPVLDRLLVQIGRGALHTRQRLAEEIADLAEIGVIFGYRVPVVMAPALWSDVADVLCGRFPDAPFAATYRPDEAGGYRLKYGLASRGDFNVFEVAQMYGGGGHARAAGFQARHLVHLPRPAHNRPRPDGWPLCPRCGEDELFSTANPPDPAGILKCYRCGFVGLISPSL